MSIFVLNHRPFCGTLSSVWSMHVLKNHWSNLCFLTSQSWVLPMSTPRIPPSNTMLVFEIFGHLMASATTRKQESHIGKGNWFWLVKCHRAAYTSGKKCMQNSSDYKICTTPNIHFPHYKYGQSNESTALWKVSESRVHMFQEWIFCSYDQANHYDSLTSLQMKRIRVKSERGKEEELQPRNQLQKW